MRNLIYLFLIVVMSIVISTCASGLGNGNLNQTGLLDQSGNLITNTLIKTNIAYFRGTIPIWATNGKYDYIIYTNTNSEIEIRYTNEVIYPDYPDDASDYYSITVPYAGKTYYTVSYKDTNRLKQLWLDQIFRKGQSDGKVFAIRNRDNGKDNWRDINNFQNLQKDNRGASRYDYYYFKDNGDIVYKGGDKNVWDKEHLVKRFVGAVIVDYRKVKERSKPEEGIFIVDKVENTVEWTVGAIYKMAIDVNEARELFKGSGVQDGVYNFIGIRKLTAVNRTSVAMFTRQFHNTNFMEVLVLNPYSVEWELNKGTSKCLGVDAYYAYYGDYYSEEGELNVKGFTHENYPYMTDENLYLGKRPEDIVPLLSYTTRFTETIYNWRFLAIPGHKY